MPEVCAGTDTCVFVLGEFKDVVRVPHFVVGFVWALWVVVVTDLDVEFLDHLVDSVDGLGAFGVDDFDF